MSSSSDEFDSNPQNATSSDKDYTDKPKLKKSSKPYPKPLKAPTNHQNPTKPYRILYTPLYASNPPSTVNGSLLLTVTR
jgi:hypothetical protein